MNWQDDRTRGGAPNREATGSGKNTAVTMRDVATLSGFSPATVSIVLNNAPLARYRSRDQETH